MRLSLNFNWMRLTEHQRQAMWCPNSNDIWYSLMKDKKNVNKIYKNTTLQTFYKHKTQSVADKQINTYYSCG